jgi:hypothetical protein
MSAFTKLRAAVRVRVVRLKAALVRALGSLKRVSRDGLSAARGAVAPHASRARAVFASAIDALAGHAADLPFGEEALPGLARAYVALLAAATFSHLLGLPGPLAALLGLATGLAKLALVAAVAASLAAGVAARVSRRDALRVARAAAAAGLLWMAGVCYVLAGASYALGLAVRPADPSPVAAIIAPAPQAAEPSIFSPARAPGVNAETAHPAAGQRSRTRKRAAARDGMS